jgi:ribosome maturation factor RimP
VAPDRSEVAALVEPIVVGAGFDVDDVAVQRHPGSDDASITIVVDGDEGVGLEALTELTRTLTARLDQQPWAQQYALEVMSRGVESPLTLPRHWRRNHGRKVELVIGGTAGIGETVHGRIGNLIGDTVSVVVNRKGRLGVREVALADVESAVVAVEFGEPSPAELRLCRGDD